MDYQNEDLDLNYDTDTQIDEHALDVELLMQSSIAKKYALNKIYLQEVAARAEEKVKTVRSDLIQEANEDPEGTIGKKKPNAQDIEAYYRRNTRYKKAKEQSINANSEAEYAVHMQMEISYGRRRSIEGLITLHGQQYFAGPRVPRNIEDIEKGKQVRQKQMNTKIKMKRRNS